MNNYPAYLRTRHWLAIKSRIRQTYGKCHDCGTTRSLDVHHLTYERIGHEKLSDLRLLCRDCHYRTHRMKKGIRHWRPDDMITSMWSWIIKAYKLPRQGSKKYAWH